MIRARRMSFSTLVILAWGLLLAALLSGCVTQSVHPLYDDRSLIADARIVGEWRDDDGPSWTFERAGRRSYTLTYADDDGAIELEARLVRLGETNFIDLLLDDAPEGAHEMFGAFMLPVHTVLKVDEIGAVLKLSSLRPSWVREHADDPARTIDHVFVDGRALLTAETPTLQRFYAGIADEAAAWESGVELQRIASEGVFPRP